MKYRTSIKHGLAAATATVALTLALVGGGMTGASAAPEHQGTDPYNTGCANTAQLIGSRNLAQATVTVWTSTACGTNWIEYYGAARWVNKFISGPYGALLGEHDYGTWSYSMQVYAPGTSTISGQWVFDGLPFRFTCSTVCTWS